MSIKFVPEIIHSNKKNEDFYSYNIMVYENLSKLKCIFENINGNIE